MGRLRSMLLFGLIAYFGGFATAIYYLAPVSQDAAKTRGKTVQASTWKDSANTEMNKEKFQEMAGEFGQRMRDYVALAEEKVQQAVAVYKAQAAAKQEGKEG